VIVVGKTDVYCPSCDEMFEAKEWEVGACPFCSRGYSWDEACTDDYSDCWTVVEWDEVKTEIDSEKIRSEEA
jgi:hypothetical protein